MAKVEDEHTPGAVRGSASTLDREDRADRGGLKALRRDDDEQIDPTEFDNLLKAYDNSFRNIAEGEVVKGTVLKVTPSEVIVDVGYKSEGIIQIDEFLDETGQVTVEAGDIVDVLLERTEDREGYVVLSREKAEKMKIWDEVEKAYAERKVVIGRVIERIKGGLAVEAKNLHAELLEAIGLAGGPTLSDVEYWISQAGPLDIVEEPEPERARSVVK